MVSMSSSSMLLAEILSWVAAAESSRSHNELKSGKKVCNYRKKLLLAYWHFPHVFLLTVVHFVF